MVWCGGVDADVGDEEGWSGVIMLLPAEPQTVAAIPGQGVEVGQEVRLLQVLPHKLEVCCECGYVLADM